MSSKEPLARVPSVFGREIAELVPQHAARIGVAISGGSDSTALLLLLADWAESRDVSVLAFTFDHALRDGSAKEAKQVADLAKRAHVEHQIERWEAHPGSGNLQAQARAARYAALSNWARRERLDAVCLGHTRDDQAETFLMRLARGSGVDGLAAMRPESVRDGVLWLRPLMSLTREELRSFLVSRSATWIDDPSNENASFDRIAFRKAANTLSSLGLSAERLSATAKSMQRAQVALAARAAAIGQEALETDGVVVRIDLEKLASAEEETRLRILAHVLCWVSGSEYRPRLKSLEPVWLSLSAGQSITLHGCQAVVKGAHAIVFREYAAVRALDAPLEQLWDGKWRIRNIDVPGGYVAALGEAGLRQIERPEDQKWPFAVLHSLPAVWVEGSVKAVPHLNWGVSSQIDRIPDRDTLIPSLFPH